MSTILNRLRGGGKGRDVAPTFTLSGASGRPFSIKDQLGVKRTLLLFYPQDMTSG